MHKFLTVLCCFVHFFELSAVQASENHYIQVGAYRTHDEAQAQVDRIINLRISGATTVQTTQTEAASARQTPFRTLIGPVGRRDAMMIADSLTSSAIPNVVRNAVELDTATAGQIVLGALESAAQPAIAAPQAAAAGATSDEGTLPPEYLAILRRPDTTSPQTLRELEAAVSALANENPARATLALPLISRKLRLLNPYVEKAASVDDLRALARDAVDGRMVTTPEQLITAGKHLARIEHYFDHDRKAALQTYQHVLERSVESGDLASVALVRMQIAAATMELAKSSGMDTRQIQRPLIDLYSIGLSMQADFESTTSREARQIRWTTCRIGLMATELYMENRMFDEALTLNKELTGLYTERPECQEELAEAWCHQAQIALERGDRDMTFQAIANAIQIAEQKGKPIWGDPERDPNWKAHAWKYLALHRFGAAPAECDALRDHMKKRFHGHPGLAKFFGQN